MRWKRMVEKHEQGQAMVEFSLIIFLVAIVALGGVVLLSSGVGDLWSFNVESVTQAFRGALGR